MFFKKTRRPKDLTEGANVNALGETFSSIAEGAEFARKQGIRIATLPNVMLSNPFSEKATLSDTWIVDSKDARMPKSHGWYVQDKETGELKKTTREIIYNPNYSWNQKILILPFVMNAKGRGELVTISKSWESSTAMYVVADTCVRASHARIAAVAGKDTATQSEKSVKMQPELAPIPLRA